MIDQRGWLWGMGLFRQDPMAEPVAGCKRQWPAYVRPAHPNPHMFIQPACLEKVPNPRLTVVQFLPNGVTMLWARNAANCLLRVCFSSFCASCLVSGNRQGLLLQ